MKPDNTSTYEVMHDINFDEAIIDFLKERQMHYTLSTENFSKKYYNTIHGEAPSSLLSTRLYTSNIFTQIYDNIMIVILSQWNLNSASFFSRFSSEF